MFLTFAWRYFKGKKSANAINIIAWVTVGVIAFATTCQILVLSVFNGFEGLVKSLYSSFYTDIKIIPANGKTFILTPDQINAVKHQPGIYALSMVAEEKALIKNDEQQTIVYLKGVSDNYGQVCGVQDKTFQGKFNTGTAESPGLVVGYGIQNAISVNISGAASQPSVINIILPKKGYISIADPLQSISEGSAIASGIFAIQQEFDNKYAFTNIDFVKQQMGFAPNEYSAVEIRLSNNAEIQEVKTAITKLLGNQYTVLSKYEQNMSLYSTMKLEKWAIYSILTLILIIAAFNMVSALTMLVLEKKRDISILQSLGAGKAAILKIFLGEGMLLGVIGTAIGLILAVIICFLQVNFKLIKIEGGSFLIDYFPVKLQFADFLLVSATALLITLIASMIPALKASQQQIELRSN